MPHPEAAPLVIGTLIATVIAHIALMLLRGWIIAQSRKQCKDLDMRVKALEGSRTTWEKEQEARFEDFTRSHASPWEVIKRKKA